MKAERRAQLLLASALLVAITLLALLANLEPPLIIADVRDPQVRLFQAESIIIEALANASASASDGTALLRRLELYLNRCAPLLYRAHPGLSVRVLEAEVAVQNCGPFVLRGGYSVTYAADGRILRYEVRLRPLRAEGTVLWLEYYHWSSLTPLERRPRSLRAEGALIIAVNETVFLVKPYFEKVVLVDDLGIRCIIEYKIRFKALPLS